MTFEHHTTRNPVGLLARFRDVGDAEAAAQFLVERGVPSRTVLLEPPSPSVVGGIGLSRQLATSRRIGSLVSAACGAVIGLVGNYLWVALYPDVLSPGWRIGLTILAGGTAAGGLGLLVGSGFGPRTEGDAMPGGDHGAVIAIRVREGHVDYAADILHGIGADRVVVLNDSTAPGLRLVGPP